MDQRYVTQDAVDLVESSTQDVEQLDILRESTIPSLAVLHRGRLVSLVGSWDVAGQTPVEKAEAMVERLGGSLGYSSREDLGGPRVLEGEDHEMRVRFGLRQGGAAWFRKGVEVWLDMRGRVILMSACLPERDPTPETDVDPSAALTAARAAVWGGEGEPPKLVAHPVWVDPRALGEYGATPRAMFEIMVQGEDGPATVLVSTDGSTVFLLGTRPESIPAFAPVPRFHVNPTALTPDFVSFAPTGLLLPEAASGDPETVAFALLARYPRLFGTGAPHEQLELARVDEDVDPVLGGYHVVLQQRYHGVPVHGCQLRFHLGRSLAIRAITGVYYRDPGVRPEPALDAGRARAIAVATHLADGGREGLGLPPAAAGELCVLPTALTRNWGPQNHLAWRFPFPDYDSYVSAATGARVMRIPTVDTTVRVYDSGNSAYRDSMGRLSNDYHNFAQLQFVDGVKQVPGNPTPQALEASNRMTEILNWFSSVFNRSSWDGRGGNVDVYVDAGMPVPNASSHKGVLVFGAGEAVPDVIGHEFTHSIVDATCDLQAIDESGAINESFADVFGELMFPETPATSWVQGDLLTINRALHDPSKSAPKGKQQAAHYRDYFVSRMDNGMVHANSTILSLAAVLLADGRPGTGHTGIGRSRLANLYWHALTYYLHPWATFLDLLHINHQLAQAFAAVPLGGVPGAPLPELGGAQPPGHQAGDADEVLWAFAQVGLDPVYTLGWFTVKGRSPQDATFYEGVTLPGGQTVNDVAVRGMWPGFMGSQVFVGEVRASGPTEFDDNVVGVTLEMLQHGQGTANATTRVRVTSTDMIDLVLSAYLDIAFPPAATPPTTIHDSGAVARGPNLVGEKWLDILYIADLLPLNCTVVDVELCLLGPDLTSLPGTTNRFGAPPALWNSSGAWIVGRTIGSRSLAVTVESYFDSFQAVRYRLRYFVRGPVSELTGWSLPPMSVTSSRR
jgi:Zn-dependent metalloprotease